MKVLHLPYTYFPAPVGGTELYVAALADELRALGIASAVAVPDSVHGVEKGEHDGVAVYRYGGSARGDLGEWYGAGDPATVATFRRVLADARPDVVHFHALSRGTSVRLVRAARRSGIPVVLTYHTPTASCLRGTLLRNGRTPCDGRLYVWRCADCVMQAHGVPAPARALLHRLPPAAGRLLRRADARGGTWTALRMTELVAVHHEQLEAVLAEVDAVVAVCQWVRDLLRDLGVPLAKVTLCRQGVRRAGVGARRPPRPLASAAPRPLRGVVVGRVAPEKGLDVLVRAVESRPDLAVSIDVFGVVQHGTHTSQRRLLEDTLRRDVRVRLLPPLAPDDVVQALAGYDLTIVPSQVLETGPLTVYESFAAGVPVLGSDLGGVAELVRDGVDGLLVRAPEPEAWASALAMLAADRTRLEALAAGVTAPRTMADVAREMAALYDRVGADVAAPALITP